MSLGNALRKLRERNGMTQEQFADKIGIKRTTYISYETSKTSPDFSLVEKISEIFDVSILYFKSDDDEIDWSELNSNDEIYRAGPVRKPTVPTAEEEFIIAYFRSLNKEEKAEFFENIKNDYLDRKCGFSDK